MSTTDVQGARPARPLVTELHSPTFVVQGNAVVDANDAALRLLGATRAELPQIRFDAMFVDPRAPEQLREEIAASPRSAIHAQLRLRSVGGVEQEVSATITPCGDEGGEPAMQIMATRAVIVALGTEPDDRYAQLFNSAGHAMLVVDATDRTILAANSRALGMYQLPFDALEGRPLASLLGESNAATLCGVSAPIECDAIRGDGSKIQVEASSTEIAYRGHTAILIVQRDIGGRKRIQNALQQIEERFDLFMNSVTEYAMIILDRNGRVEAWSGGAERLTGFTAADTVGQDLSMFYTPDDQKAGRATADLAMASGGGSCAYDEWQLRKDGSTFYGSVLLAAMRDDSGALHGYARIVRDSSDRRRLEHERAALNATLELIAREWVGTFDAIDAPVVLVDEDQAIRRLNRAAQRLAALPFAELLQRKLGDFDTEPWKTASALASSAAQNGGAMVATDIHDTNRSWHIEASSAELDMIMKRTVVVIRDTTETRRLEESLRQAEVASALGTMIAGVAHEVRRPLFQLSSTIDACAARMGEQSDFQRYVPRLRASIDAMNGLIHELLDYTRPQPLACAFHPPKIVVREAVSQCAALAQQKNITIRIDDRDAPLDAWYDAARITQVLQNVIENAIQHTPDGGIIVVRIWKAASGGIEFVVEDDGTGFTGDDLERAAQPFYTKRPGGSGLGLAIVKKIIDAHGGSLTLGNRETGGAIVSIALRPQPEGAQLLVT